jgi:multidrug resistance protein MdtO
MGALAQNVPKSPRSFVWFREFLRQELTPYSGRFETVARMVIAATLVMIVCVTFRIPYAFEGVIYTFIISRENPIATLKSAGTTLLFVGIGAAYVLLSVGFVISVPILHFLWVIGSFFLSFYALSAMTNYGAASTFAVVIAVGVPIWDRHVSAETNVEDTLWLTLAVSVGAVVVAAIELAFAHINPGDDIVLPIAERLSAVEKLLSFYGEDRPVDQAIEKTITRLELLGTSMLRRILRRAAYSPEYTLQMGGVVALVGRLVDIAAALIQLSFPTSGSDQKQLRNLAVTVARIRTDVINRRIPGAIQFDSDDELSPGVPLLREMEKLVKLIPQAFAGSRSMDAYVPSSDDIPGINLVSPDAFVNPEHLKFALKGCLAASSCYIIYNAIAWPSIGAPAMATCLLTALSAVGASRQRQILRFAAFVVGGLFLGIGSEVFILPHLDSITGFTLFFMLVIALASWFITSSPRLSYFGFQIVVIFCLINLQEFARQTSLAAVRDRIAGVFLGLCMMWLVFDQLWGSSAAVEMKRVFISNLRLLAQFVREPLAEEGRPIERSHSLRENINANFDTTRASADGVLFEFGASRQQDLALRNRIRQWQPKLRALFVIRIALRKYRLQLPGFELPEGAHVAQQEFDDRIAQVLDAMATRMENGASEERVHFEGSFERLKEAAGACCASGPGQLLSVNLQPFLTLSRTVENIATSLEKEMRLANL